MPKNQDKNRQDNPFKAYDIALRLIEAIYTGNASEETQERMVQWFKNGVNDDVKLDAFEHAMYVYLKKNEHPDEIDRREFEALKIRLGLDKIAPTQSRRQTSRKHIPLRIFGQIAAVLVPALLFIGGSLWLRDRENTVIPEERHVAARHVTVSGNESKKIVLDDGTEVILNEASEFSYSNRECTLKGEGYFKVAKGDKPFTIHTDNIDVTVLGTEFNLRAYPDQECSVVSLYTGTVEIGYEKGSFRLLSGDVLSYNNNTRELQKTNSGEIKPLWIDVKETSQVYSLGEILRLIEQEYGVVIENKQIPDTSQPYTFTLKEGESIETVMSTLKVASGDFNFRVEKNRIIIEPV